MSEAIPLDPASMDTSVDPGDDFFRFANGHWLVANPVPPEYGRWGAFSEVHVRNEELLHDLLVAAMSDTSQGDSSGRLAGDYFASGLDTYQIEAAGLEPIRSWLDRVDAIASTGDFNLLVTDLHTLGARALFGCYVAPDYEDSARYLLFLGQGGLGLPERDYYLRTTIGPMSCEISTSATSLRSSSTSELQRETQRAMRVRCSGSKPRSRRAPTPLHNFVMSI